MGFIENIASSGKPLCLIIRAEHEPDETKFLTSAELGLQVGFVVYSKGGEIHAHEHRPLMRHIRGTCEVLFIKKGRCVIDVYNDERTLEASRELRTGDTALILGGGHGVRMLEDTIILEVKQGPYMGAEEKDRF
jgi:hypothetical protein